MWNKAKVVSYSLLLLFIVTSCTESSLSKAKGSVSNFEVTDDVFLSNGLDYGAKIRFTLKNIGESGAIEVRAKLSSSEGTWSRNQTLHLRAGESREVLFNFSEPSINATNIEGSVNVRP